MQKISLLIVITVFLAACGTSKKAVTTPKTETAPEVITETIVEIPETPEVEPQKETVEQTIENESKGEMSQTTPIQIIDEPASVEELPAPETVEPVTFFNHSSFNTLVSQYVTSEGNVDYGGFKKNWSTLRAYIKSLGESVPTDSWTKEDKLAYWMNAYNAMTVDLILRNYPLESIKDIKDPWDQRLWKLGSKWYNLNEIEHQILRKMGDARIHFGINCASFSCPPLLNEAFTADKVDSQLDQLARDFINDTKRNTITTDRVDVSKIFTWFAKDFKTDGSLVDFLNKYSATPISDKAKVRYRDYDWNLNK